MSAKTITKPARKTLATSDDWFGGSMMDLRRQMDRLFDSFTGPWHLPATEPMSALRAWPESSIAVRFEVSESDDSFEISAELPGMEEKDVKVVLDDGTLTVKGEKKAEFEERKKDYYVMERHYGSFRRGFRLPDTVDESKVKAKFEKGVLQVTLPKAASAKKKSKKISISKS